LKKIVIVVGAFLALAVSAPICFLFLAKPDVAAPAQVKVAGSPERLERGRYLFETVANCGDCHSARDFSKYTAPEYPGKHAAGQVFPTELGFPGTIVAPNITPDREMGVGTWTDGELIRAIREGISKDGHALFGFMPYASFAHMSDEDLYALIAYLRALPAAKNSVPRTRLDFPVSWLNRLGPKAVRGPVKAPDPKDLGAYGGYLVTMAGCIECHTQLENGEPAKGLEFAGGHTFQIGKLVVNSANITPDDETGIGRWSERRFLARFRANDELTYANAPQANQASFTIMNWRSFAQLKDDDLRAIYAFLRTVKPIHNAVDVHPAQPGS
jgi:mono/diheme cytochrome c family protein